MLLDAHAHAFPDVASGRRWQQLLGVQEPRRSGAIEHLGACAEEAEIARVVLLLLPRSRERHEQLSAEGRLSEEEIVRELRDELVVLNRWGCEVGAGDPRFLPFAGINVRYMSETEIVREIDAVAALGARGIKLIPPSMQVYANDPLLWPVYRRCSELGLPILSQSGIGGGPPPTPGADHYGRPRYFDEVLSAFPDLTLILAHMGLGYEEDVVSLTERHANVHTDTSLRLSRLGRPGNPTPAELVDLIRRIGVDRTLFGTNYPFVDPRAYRERLEALPLSPRERELIAYRNFMAVLPPVAQED